MESRFPSTGFGSPDRLMYRRLPPAALANVGGWVPPIISWPWGWGAAISIDRLLGLRPQRRLAHGHPDLCRRVFAQCIPMSNHHRALDLVRLYPVTV